MAKDISIDFAALDSCISEMKALLDVLEPPTSGFSVLSYYGSSGDTYDNLVGFNSETLKFHKAVYSLVESTAAYLETVKLMEQTDQSIA